jgi:hypothetical protein
MELRRDDSGQTHTEGSKAEHGDNLARTAAGRPVTRKAEASAGSATGGRRITMQGDDVQNGDVWRWRPVAVSSEEPRTASSLEPRRSGEAFMARRVERRSYGAKAVVGRDELGGDVVQPGTTSSLHLYGSRGGSNATRV